jgi:hypothetical protein
MFFCIKSEVILGISKRQEQVLALGLLGVQKKQAFGMKVRPEVSQKVLCKIHQN